MEKGVSALLIPRPEGEGPGPAGRVRAMQRIRDLLEFSYTFASYLTGMYHRNNAEPIFVDLVH
jgi:hypothetical protein